MITTQTRILAPLPVDVPVGLYIHVPFCAHICPYCDFNTYAGQEARIPRYVNAVCQEVRTRAEEISGRPLATVYLGGGTPSLLDGEQIAQIMLAVRDAYTIIPDAEITMEANPNALDDARLHAYRRAGINRLSIGAQTLDRRGLRTLGRQHEAADVLMALRAARAAGFDRLNLDLIFGWPGQTPDSWRRDLTQVLDLGNDGPDHLSLYSLIVEPGTPFADAQSRGILRMPDDDATADLYDEARMIMADAGWTHYEIANWSRDPDGWSRHNAIYWQHGDYLGIGAGAFGTIGRERAMNHLLPETYIAAVEASGHGRSNVETIDADTAIGETMMLGLRLLRDGVDAGAFARRHGVELEDRFGPAIAEMIDGGFIERTDRGIRLTLRGMMIANDVILRFL